MGSAAEVEPKAHLNALREPATDELAGYAYIYERTSCALTHSVTPGCRGAAVAAVASGTHFDQWASRSSSAIGLGVRSLGVMHTPRRRVVERYHWGSGVGVLIGGPRMIEVEVHAWYSNAIFEYLEIFHNRQRRHSALGMLTPVEFEAVHQPVTTA